MRNEWDMAFATGGLAALDLMAQDDFDVIVSDMRMPEMDGAELLTAVKETYPRTVRIILSGHAEREMILRTVRPAHQYLSKPCDAETIKTTIRRACALRDVLNQESLKAVTCRLESLPCVPSLYNKVMEELQRPDCSIDRVGCIIATDVAMTAKILQLTNSAFFGMRRRFSEVTKAVVFLGLDTVKSLVFTLGVFEQFDSAKMEVLNIENLMNHSLRTSALCKRIAAMEGAERASIEESFTGALLHDIGKLVLADNLPDIYREISEMSRVEEIPVYEAEKRILNATHAEVGGYLLGLWGLSDNIVEAVAFHHHPSKHSSSRFEPLIAVHVADAIDAACVPNAKWASCTPAVDMNLLARIGLDGRLNDWISLSQMKSEESI